MSAGDRAVLAHQIRKAWGGPANGDGKHHNKGDKVGAFQSFEKGRTADVSCACHWTVNVAASNGHGRMSRDVYSVAPAGIFVHPDSKIKRPEDLAGLTAHCSIRDMV